MPDLSPSYPHLPVREALDKIRWNDKGKPRKHILIAGGGIAGLVAAYELEALGHTVKIVEGSHRIGGRVLTHHFSDGSYNELGAMRVPITHDYTHYYIDRMNLAGRLIPFVNSMDRNFLDIHQVVTKVTNSRSAIYPEYGLPSIAPTPPDAYPQDNGGAIFGWILGNAIATLTDDEKISLFKGELNSDRLRYLDSLSLGAFLDTVLPTRVKQLVGAYTSLAVWFDKAVTMFIRDTIVGTGNGLQTLLGGMSQLPDAITTALGSTIIERNAEVTRIRIASETHVEADIVTADGKRTEEADFMLCTLPFGVMRRLTLEGFSYEKMLSISQIAYAASTKVILDCSRRFWQSNYGIYGGASVSDGIQRQTYYPMDHIQAVRSSGQPGKASSLHSQTTQPEAVMIREDADASLPGALLGAYCWGSDATRLGIMSPGARAEVVRQGISRFHPEILDDKLVVDHASICWESHKWSAGAFAFLLPGQLGSIWLNAKRPEGRLFFAGEHCSLDQAWIQGALIASLEAVNEIVSV